MTLLSKLEVVDKCQEKTPKTVSHIVVIAVVVSYGYQRVEKKLITLSRLFEEPVKFLEPGLCYLHFLWSINP